jgi:hypothetical protein
MVNYQTNVQKTNSIRFGSAKIEVGADTGSLVNLGVATSVEFTEEYAPIVLKPDNAPEITAGVKDHFATVKFEMWELDLDNLALIRGGIDTVTDVVGSATPVSDEPHTLNDTDFVRLDNKNGDNTAVTSIVVTDADDNAAVLNTDYVIAVDPAGYTCIARVSTSTVITDGDGAKVSYSYTPNASTEFSTGGLNTISPRVVRLTNTNAAGKKFEITVYSAKNQGGIDLKLPSDDAEDPMKPSIELKGTIDTTRTAGDQLFKIVDEQGV